VQVVKRPVVLVAIKGLGIGGAEKLISEGVRFWDRDRFDYRIAYMLPWKNQLVPEIEAFDVSVTCLGTQRGMTPGSVARLRGLVSDIGADIVHAHSPSVGIAARAVVPVPLVYTEHNLAGSYRQPTRTLNRASYGRNAAVTAVSQPVAVSLEGFNGPTPVVIENGVSVNAALLDAASSRSELRLGPDDPLVVHVGNIRPGKGHDTLIEAVRYLPDNVTVVSIGAEKWEGDLARVREDSVRAGVESQLQFLGRRPDALSFIAAADVYVNPADHEGLPVTILEALALERPVVATAVGGVPSVVQDGETGVLVQPQQPTELAAAISALLRDPPYAQHLAERGRRLVEEEYGLEPMVRAFEQVYSEVLDG
jgi:glycosyltransferase involved in cell wall biosynthesis